jgi:hypothetical protein
MKRFFCVLLFVGCLLTFGACSLEEAGGSGTFFESFYNDYIMIYFEEYITSCTAFGQYFAEVPVVGTVLEFIVTALAYAIGGIILAIRIVFAFVLYFLIETASFVEEIIRAISETVLDMIS